VGNWVYSFHELENVTLISMIVTINRNTGELGTYGMVRGKNLVRDKIC
jgi:hypothetical protein